jgi:hypothetical protein
LRPNEPVPPEMKIDLPLNMSEFLCPVRQA